MRFLNSTRILLNNGILELRGTYLSQHSQNVFQKMLKSVLGRKGFCDQVSLGNAG